MARAPGAFWDAVDGHTMVCEPRSGELYRLNPTAAYLWEACHDTPVDALTDRLAAAFPDEDVDVLAADTRRFVGAMCEMGLLTVVAGTG